MEAQSKNLVAYAFDAYAYFGAFWAAGNFPAA
jgi:hypothetical protein